jgi:hypothetical protein
MTAFGQGWLAAARLSDRRFFPLAQEFAIAADRARRAGSPKESVIGAFVEDFADGGREDSQNAQCRASGARYRFVSFPSAYALG